MPITPDHLYHALNLPDFDGISAQSPMAPLGRHIAPPPDAPPPRQAAVLVLLYPQADDFHIILTRRQPHLRGHSGQISFPGGRAEDADDDLTQTALRETCEELGICTHTTPLQILGTLTRVYIPPSNHDVHPVVALTPQIPHIQPNPDEVAEAFTLSLTNLLNPRIKGTSSMRFRDETFDVPHYAVNGHHVWGATAAMLSELEHRLRAVL